MAEKTRFGRDISNTTANTLIHRNMKRSTYHSYPILKTKCPKPLTNLLADLQLENEGKEDNGDRSTFCVKDSSTFQSDESVLDDADDEKETNSMASSNDTKGGSVDNRIVDLLSSQVNTKGKNEENSKFSVQRFCSDFEKINDEEQGRKYTFAARSSDLEEIIQYYNGQLQKINDLAAERLDQFNELEESFNKIQQTQSQVYQNHLQYLQKQLKFKEEEMEDMKRNYTLVEQWVLTLFKELGDCIRANPSSLVKLSGKQIKKSLQPPVKKTELESIYRYLVQYLYLDGENEAVT